MSNEEYKYQKSLIDKHFAKADQCIEYGKLEDAKVHMMVGSIILAGLDAQMGGVTVDENENFGFKQI